MTLERECKLHHWKWEKKGISKCTCQNCGISFMGMNYEKNTTSLVCAKCGGKDFVSE